MSQGQLEEINEKVEEPVVAEPGSSSEETTVKEVTHAKVEDAEVGIVQEKVLVDEGDGSSGLEAEEGVAQGGSADTGEDKEDDMSVKDIVSSESREKLAETTKGDSTLANARAFADQVKKGYHWTEGLLFRTRLDVLGDSVGQLCLPLPYRTRCLSLAHENFGHAGCNKMCLHVRKFFYWPAMTSDVTRHIRSCEKCQKHDKKTPRQMPMQEREIVTVPSERVCEDIVGPFPVAKGFFRFILTYLDMATRWPEAIPLRKTTTKIIIEQLLLIFSRNGFPTILVSDNGPQFVSGSFKKFLKTNGIDHVTASPYHPQGNRVIERMHRTLNAVVAKTVDTKGNWAQVVLMALYFLRCTPNRASGLSPFVLKHGQEPTTPLQLLYKGWVQQELGPVDLEEWVAVNAERVQKLRDQAVVNMSACSEERKKIWDKRAKTREFEKGDLVYMRKSGIIASFTKIVLSTLWPIDKLIHCIWGKVLSPT